MNKLYKLSQRKFSGSIPWTELFLDEYSLPDDKGNWQRVRIVCSFGNIENKENRSTARKVKKFLEGIK